MDGLNSSASNILLSSPSEGSEIDADATDKILARQGLTADSIRDTKGKRGADMMLSTLGKTMDFKNTSPSLRMSLASGILTWQCEAPVNVRTQAFRNSCEKFFFAIEFILSQPDDEYDETTDYSTCGIQMPALYLAQAAWRETAENPLPAAVSMKQDSNKLMLNALVNSVNTLLQGKITLQDSTSEEDCKCTASRVRAETMRCMVLCIPQTGGCCA